MTREEAKKIFYDLLLFGKAPCKKEELEDLCKVVLTALEQEPKTGHWKPYLKEGLRYQCSACDSRFDTPWEYCPHCGAKMAETEET